MDHQLSSQLKQWKQQGSFTQIFELVENLGLVIVLGILMLACLDGKLDLEITSASLMLCLWKAESAVGVDSDLFLSHSAGDAEPWPK